MNYQIRHIDYRRGIISAFKGENPGTSALLDLKFTSEHDAVEIAIISSTLSKIFGTIYHNPESEQRFIDTLFDMLEARQIFHPTHAFNPELVEAIAS